ncbi:uncharacterized protein LOC108045547 isoform X2 [Drosophila rhopaloa]|uniref:Uncharacterized protein n=1 Tax=Drosophila rhopaloa TaxID=1041015 RepID=A0ABM5JFD9_DRORH|nr:uncharacterized protein LOC108045547 isoform X2 [Drosophila rhopaloa]
MIKKILMIADKFAVIYTELIHIRPMSYDVCLGRASLLSEGAKKVFLKNLCPFVSVAAVGLDPVDGSRSNVELQIISTFALVVLSWWADFLTFFAVALILVVLFLIIGVFLPAKMDLTLDIAILFIMAFIFLIIASFVLLFQLLVARTVPYAYLVVEIAVTLTILLFVMYHGQTINGNRFAEMRLNDFFLASLILFHDFLIIFWLTFYWQTNYRPITPDSWIETSTTNSTYSNSSDNKYRNLYGNSDWGKRYDPRTTPFLDDDPWYTRSLDYGDDDGEYDIDNYPRAPKGRGRGGNRGVYGNRDHNDRDPMDRQRPNNRDSTNDWSVYNRRPNYGGRNKERARTKDPIPSHEYHENRSPDEWDPEYITQGVDREVPFDDRYDVKSGESYNTVDRTPNENVGPRIEYGDAEGKSEVGLGNPPIDFPLADHQSGDDSTINKMHKSEDSPNIYIVPKAQHIGNREYYPGGESPFSSSNDPPSDTQNGNLEIISQPEEIIKVDDNKHAHVLPSSSTFQESEFKKGDPNLLDDEMKGLTKQQFEGLQPDLNSGYTPQWEELNEDEIRKLLGQQIAENLDKYRKDQDRWVEPLITREPYIPINHPDYEKIVMNDSLNVLI